MATPDDVLLDAAVETLAALLALRESPAIWDRLLESAADPAALARFFAEAVASAMSSDDVPVAPPSARPADAPIVFWFISTVERALSALAAARRARAEAVEARDDAYVAGAALVGTMATNLASYRPPRAGAALTDADVRAHDAYERARRGDRPGSAAATVSARRAADDAWWYAGREADKAWGAAANASRDALAVIAALGASSSVAHVTLADARRAAERALARG